MNRNHIITKELKDRYNFEVKEKYQASLLNWLEWSKGLKVAGDKIIVEEHLGWTKEEVLQEVVNEGQCEGCDMPEFIIQHEINAGEMTEHLMCSGCGKHCDGGDKSKDNQYTFPIPKHGAWVFWKGFPKERVEEWYCPNCKFQMLCGDCGSPNLDLENVLGHKPAGEDFYICVDCTIERQEEEHQENHFGKGQPDPDCGSCQDFVAKWPEEKDNKETKLVIEGREFNLIKDESELGKESWYCGELGIVIEKIIAKEDHYREIGDYDKERRLIVEKKGRPYFRAASCGYEANPERYLEHYAERTMKRLEKEIEKVKTMNAEEWKTYNLNWKLKKGMTQERWIEKNNKRFEQAKKGWLKLKALKDEWLKRVEAHNEKEVWRV